MKECPRCNACLEDSDLACPSDESALASAFAGSPVLDGKYLLERRLGSGGMGSVYRARHLGLERCFALKLIRGAQASDAAFRQRFELEARALGRLRHPHIVDVTDYGIDRRPEGDLPYLVMELLDGSPLSAIAVQGTIPPEEALPILDDIAAALDYAHAQGILHRDLKPANVIVVGSGPEATAKVLDFGLARIVGGEALDVAQPPAGSGTVSQDESRSANRETLDLSDPDATREDSTRSGERLTRGGPVPGGTPGYMAPEVLHGREATPAYDIYAFGVLAHELLVGRLPFGGTPDVMLRGRRDDAPSPPSATLPLLPPELDDPLLAALDKDPERRPKRAADVVARIRSAWQAAQRRLWHERELPRRRKLAAGVTPLLVVASVGLGRLDAVDQLERRTVDFRFALTDSRPADPRILLATVDETVLAATDPADEIAPVLKRVLDAGAAGVALDLLLPERWAQSQAFAELILEHADRLALAVFSTPEGEVVGADCLNPLAVSALGPERVSRMFGFVNLDKDPDGVVRQGRLSYADESGSKRPSWAAQAAQLLGGPGDEGKFWIDYSARWEQEPLPWGEVLRRLDQDASTLSDRLVLLGAAYAAAGDRHRVPAQRGRSDLTGFQIQALMVDTIVSGFPIREASTPAPHLIFGLACGAVLLVFLSAPRAGAGLALLAAYVLAVLAASHAAFASSSLLLPTVAPLLIGLVVVGLGLAVRRAMPPFPQARRGT